MVERKLLHTLIQATLRVIEDEGFLHHCIESAAVVVRTLRKLGVDAYPLTVGVKVMNPAMTSFTKRHGRPPHDQETMMQCHHEGGAIVVLDPNSDEVQDGQWPGHLVVIVRNVFDKLHAMIDLTIVQVNDPEWDIDVKPLLVQVDDQFVTGNSFSVESNGSMLMYKAYPENRTFGDWGDIVDSEEADRISELVVREMQ
ncbi:MAG: hypothetical protein J0M26_25380 [Planctomycetes bacterium]|nr:hypothetical protein [Planctomycetota bacterium]